ncbi:MAG: alpha/beta hydrolase [Rhizobiales bacterium]|nr:alpha/beta hydrolase [Hyphomicrobiales bacterium]
MIQAQLALPAPHDVTVGYTEWGRPGAAQTVICVHGLTRNARDFDFLARALADRNARVIALNMVGRGTSSWLADPAGYIVPAYAGHVLQFLKEQRLDSVDWVGTSMGGLIGMLIAAGENSPIRRLVLNDIGPFISQAALAQLKTYVGRDPHFATLDEAEAYLRDIHAGFGPLTDSQWRHLASHSIREADGGLRLHYDPQIKVPYAQMADADVDLWALWEKIRCPTFLLRGSESQLLTSETASRMTETGPKATLATIYGVGHAPALMADDQIALIAGWLRPGSTKD